MEQSKSLSYAVYTDPAFVAQYSESIRSNAWNAYYERPASLSLLPPLKGLHVLDAGCGPGAASEVMMQAGAHVTAIDYSHAMIEATQQLTQGGVSCLVQDLNQPLELDDGTFDAIYCALVVHYVDDLHMLFSEFGRVLKPGGTLVFSTDHPDNPLFATQHPGRKHLQEVNWDNFGVRMQVYQRLWEEVEQPCLAAGFEIAQILEPRPLEAARALHPKDYDYLADHKHFICIRAVKP